MHRKLGTKLKEPWTMVLCLGYHVGHISEAGSNEERKLHCKAMGLPSHIEANDGHLEH